MRCYICDKVLEDEHVSYNEDHKDYEPCQTCLKIIEDIIAGFGGHPAPETEEFDPVLEGFYPQTYDPFGTEESS